MELPGFVKTRVAGLPPCRLRVSCQGIKKFFFNDLSTIIFQNVKNIYEIISYIFSNIFQNVTNIMKEKKNHTYFPRDTKGE